MDLSIWKPEHPVTGNRCYHRANDHGVSKKLLPRAFNVNALIDKGLVKMDNFQKSKKKFKYVCLLSCQGIAEKVALTGQFLEREMEDYDVLKVGIGALNAEVGEKEANGFRKDSR